MTTMTTYLGSGDVSSHNAAEALNEAMQTR
jgi:hypothetical protein